MSWIRPTSVLAALTAAVLLYSCGKQASTTESTRAQNERAGGRTVNPSSFPMYPGSVVTIVVPVNSAQMFAAIKAADPSAELPPNFRGHEVIAETGATMKQLSAWIAQLKKAPPPGLRHVSEKNWKLPTDAKGRALDAGAQFENANASRTVFVIVADPRRIKEQLGPAFALIDSYNAVPGMLRGAIDDQSKKQMGYTVSEMLDAHSPVGAAISTVKRLQAEDRRAILIIDESKAK
jgi:hypothetical protein